MMAKHHPKKDRSETNRVIGCKDRQPIDQSDQANGPTNARNCVVFGYHIICMALLAVNKNAIS